jgi:hypothetical protein
MMAKVRALVVIFLKVLQYRLKEIVEEQEILLVLLLLMYAAVVEAALAQQAGQVQ